MAAPEGDDSLPFRVLDPLLVCLVAWRHAALGRPRGECAQRLNVILIRELQTATLAPRLNPQTHFRKGVVPVTIESFDDGLGGRRPCQLAAPGVEPHPAGEFGAFRIILLGGERQARIRFNGCKCGRDELQCGGGEIFVVLRDVIAQCVAQAGRNRGGIALGEFVHRGEDEKQCRGQRILGEALSGARGARFGQVGEDVDGCFRRGGCGVIEFHVVILIRRGATQVRDAADGDERDVPSVAHLRCGGRLHVGCQGVREVLTHRSHVASGDEGIARQHEAHA